MEPIFEMEPFDETCANTGKNKSNPTTYTQLLRLLKANGHTVSVAKPAPNGFFLLFTKHFECELTVVRDTWQLAVNEFISDKIHPIDAYINVIAKTDTLDPTMYIATISQNRYTVMAPTKRLRYYLKNHDIEFAKDRDAVLISAPIVILSNPGTRQLRVTDTLVEETISGNGKVLASSRRPYNWNQLLYNIKDRCRPYNR